MHVQLNSKDQLLPRFLFDAQCCQTVYSATAANMLAPSGEHDIHANHVTNTGCFFSFDS